MVQRLKWAFPSPPFFSAWRVNEESGTEGFIMLTFLGCSSVVERKDCLAMK